jgi:hypothetical protein
MTLDDTLLQKLAEWRPSGEGRQTLNLPDQGSGWRIALTADRCDELGCLLWELQLTRTGPAADGATLRAWADRVAGCVTGLLEPLQVVEVDETRAEALVRSNEPRRRGESLAYYEIVLRGTREALVRRYQATALVGKREQVSFALTHEVLAQFAADLTAE